MKFINIIMSLILVVLLSVVFAGCSKNNDPVADTQHPTESTAEATNLQENSDVSTEETAPTTEENELEIMTYPVDDYIAEDATQPVPTEAHQESNTQEATEPETTEQQVIELPFVPIN